MIGLGKKDPPAGFEENIQRELTGEFNRLVDSGDTYSKAWKTVYPRLRFVKATLLSETCGKCVYCEFQYAGVYYGDIEHILPKSKRPDLACIWKNLSCVCPYCNNAKGDYYDPDNELLNPYQHDPEEHLIFIGFFLHGTTPMGKLTVRQLDLNQDAKNSVRREFLEDLLQQISRYRRHKAEASKVIAREGLLERVEGNRPHSFLARCFLQAELPEIFAG